MAALTTRDLMTSELVTVRASDAIALAAREMRLGKIRHLPVIDDAHHLIGILTERDVLAAGTRGGQVADHMRTDIKYVHPESPAHQAAYLLLRHRIGCVPVVDASDRLVGLVTDTDFLRVAYAVTGGAVPVDELEAEEREAERV